MTEREKKFLSDIVQATKLIEEFTAETNAYENYCNDLKTHNLHKCLPISTDFNFYPNQNPARNGFDFVRKMV